MNYHAYWDPLGVMKPCVQVMNFPTHLLMSLSNIYIKKKDKRKSTEQDKSIRVKRRHSCSFSVKDSLDGISITHIIIIHNSHISGTYDGSVGVPGKETTIIDRNTNSGNTNNYIDLELERDTESQRNSEQVTNKNKRRSNSATEGHNSKKSQGTTDSGIRRVTETNNIYISREEWHGNSNLANQYQFKTFIC